MKLKKGNHDKLPVPYAFMRDDKVTFVYFLVAKKLYVDIQRAGTLGHPVLPVAPELRLDFLNRFQKSPA